jgi:hypothetical protein
VNWFSKEMSFFVTIPAYSGEKILTADVDPGEIAEGKFDLSPSTNRVRSDDSARCPIHFPGKTFDGPDLHVQGYQMNAHRQAAPNRTGNVNRPA